LDEVADLPLLMQVKLLRAIQEKNIRPIGGHEEINVDVRVLSATHKNLAECVKNGSFREDLYYRLNVIELKVPPLRQRTSDIPILAAHILKKVASHSQITTPRLSETAIKALQSYGFPGNVRELENVLERALTWAENEQITVDDLMLPDNMPVTTDEQTVEMIAAPIKLTVKGSEDVNLEDQLENQERELITQALESTRWNKTAAAKKLGITFRALRYKLKKLNLE
jgi:two-component system response regulator PilR (NtrC family)